VAAEALPADLRARLAAGLGTSTPEREAASDCAAPIVPVKTVAVATVRATASVGPGPIGSAPNWPRRWPDCWPGQPHAGE
jgi:hypothetical protein